MAAQESYDAVLVGAGAVGGWIAKDLTEAGLTVAVLDAGRTLDPARDFNEHKRPWEMPFRGRRYGSQAAQARQPIQKQCVMYDEYTAHQFIDDTENPYTTPPDRPFVWIRCRQVGGRSIVWARHVYRYGDYDLKAASRDGFGVDWPFRYADIAASYDKVESFIGVCGEAVGLPQLPDGKFLPPTRLNCGEELLRTFVKNKFGRTLMIDRSAILTRPLHGRQKCHYCGPCSRGCMTRSYYSSWSSTLPAAAATNRMTLIPNAVVSHVVVDDRGKGQGVYYVDRATRNHREVFGRVVILCASSFESVRIMLNSRSRIYPNGVANSSGVLGHYLMDSARGGRASGVLPMLRGVSDSPGNRPNGTLIVRFRNVDTKHPDFIRGYGLQGSASDVKWEHAYQTPGFGAEFKNTVRASRDWRMTLSGFGDCLPYFENSCELDKEAVDAWGIPALHVNVAFGDNERKIAKDMGESAAEMLEAAGAEDIQVSTALSTPGLSTHEVGGARMGDDAKTSVLNEYSQAHDISNLFVMGGAGFPTSPCPNPTLTMMAVAARSCDYLVREYKAGRL